MPPSSAVLPSSKPNNPQTESDNTGSSSLTTRLRRPHAGRRYSSPRRTACRSEPDTKKTSGSVRRTHVNSVRTRPKTLVQAPCDAKRNENLQIVPFRWPARGGQWNGASIGVRSACAAFARRSAPPSRGGDAHRLPLESDPLIPERGRRRTPLRTVACSQIPTGSSRTTRRPPCFATPKLPYRGHPPTLPHRARPRRARLPRVRRGVRTCRVRPQRGRRAQGRGGGVAGSGGAAARLGVRAASTLGGGA
jgi:hypothetical protein